MSAKMYVRPGKAASVIGIIAACLMLAFGIVFFWLVREDGSGIGQIFVVFWMLIVILIIAYNVYTLTSRKSPSSAMGEIDLELPDGGRTARRKAAQPGAAEKGPVDYGGGIPAEA